MATHDEDGDGVVDDCDNCPTAANVDQADTTEVAVDAFADRVGNACDLRPTLSGDKLARLDTFADASDADAWTGTGWTIADDEARAVGAASWVSRRAVIDNGVSVRAELASLEWTGAGDLRVIVDGDGVNVGGACIVRADSNADGLDELVATELGGGATQTVALGAAIQPGEPVQLIAFRALSGSEPDRTGALLCSLTHATLVTELQIALDPTVVTGMQGIHASSTVVSVTSVAVYTAPGPKTER